jgi:hypothetical protein
MLPLQIGLKPPKFRNKLIIQQIQPYVIHVDEVAESMLDFSDIGAGF